MWNSKTLKIQRTFQNWNKILELQKFFATHKWGKCTWCVKKSCSLSYKKTLKCKQKKLVTIWNYYHLKRWNTKFTRNYDTFKNSYLF